MLKSPFSYFGGKSIVAKEVWQRFGNVKNYVEPFAGSAAVLLKRPLIHFVGDKRIETINDIDGMISNFWRSIALHPEETARWADWPVNENDLHARHKWLISKKENLKDKLEKNPLYCDPQIAGWWVWGICLWIGGGFCRQAWRQFPVLSHEGDPIMRKTKRCSPSVGRDKGINVIEPTKKMMRQSRGTGINSGRKVPYSSDGPGGRGIFRQGGVKLKLPYLGGGHGGDGRGIKRLRPDIGAGKGVNRARHTHLGRNYQLQSEAYDIYDDFIMLSERLRHVRVVCGKWERVTSPTATYYHSGITGIFLDPPYLHSERDIELYAEDHDVFEDTWKYAMENGDNPKMRIAICGLDDGRQPENGWTTYRWKANGGYGRLGSGNGKNNAKRETIWFSPHCIGEETKDLFSKCG